MGQLGGKNPRQGKDLLAKVYGSFNAFIVSSLRRYDAEAKMHCGPE